MMDLTPGDATARCRAFQRVASRRCRHSHSQLALVFFSWISVPCQAQHLGTSAEIHHQRYLFMPR
ncbi:hypothetical protein CCMA1212_003347 [Trichoderma ghanense]|uniref:Uncharacterized protein n=1 Tax=Trichoderma ghanense TaxID=65468 RepID=A0ABY2HA86_9HYPO